MKKIIVLLVLALSMLLGGCSDGKKDDSNDKYDISIKVYNKTSEIIYNNSIITTERNLEKIITGIEGLKVVIENGTYGSYITSISDIKKGDDYYWSYYVNGDYASVGISAYNVKDSDVIDFKIERYGAL